MIKIDVSKLPYSKEVILKENVVFDVEKFPCHLPLIEVKKAEVEARVNRYEDFIYVNLIVKADVILQCSYSLKPFESNVKGDEEMHFASYVEEGDDDLIVYKGNSIELDKYIFDLISASVPLSPKAPGAKLPSSGKDYRVISIDEFAKEKEEKSDPRFDALKDLHLD